MLHRNAPNNGKSFISFGENDFISAEEKKQSNVWCYIVLILQQEIIEMPKLLRFFFHNQNLENPLIHLTGLKTLQTRMLANEKVGSVFFTFPNEQRSQEEEKKQHFLFTQNGQLNIECLKSI